MLYNSLKYTGKDNSQAVSSGSFSDDSDIMEYAKDAVYYLRANGVLGGYEDGSFKPDAPATRAEVAKVLFMLTVN